MGVGGSIGLLWFGGEIDMRAGELTVVWYVLIT